MSHDRNLALDGLKTPSFFSFLFLRDRQRQPNKTIKLLLQPNLWPLWPSFRLTYNRCGGHLLSLESKSVPFCWNTVYSIGLFVRFSYTRRYRRNREAVLYEFTSVRAFTSVRRLFARRIHSSSYLYKQRFGRTICATTETFIYSICALLIWLFICCTKDPTECLSEDSSFAVVV